LTGVLSYRIHVQVPSSNLGIVLNCLPIVSSLVSRQLVLLHLAWKIYVPSCISSQQIIYDYLPRAKCGTATAEFLATDPEVPVSIPGATRFSEKQWVWNGVPSAS
jgi:hypothetical protein